MLFLLAFAKCATFRRAYEYVIVIKNFMSVFVVVLLSTYSFLTLLLLATQQAQFRCLTSYHTHTYIHTYVPYASAAATICGYFKVSVFVVLVYVVGCGNFESPSWRYAYKSLYLYYFFIIYTLHNNNVPQKQQIYFKLEHKRMLESLQRLHCCWCCTYVHISS